MKILLTLIPLAGCLLFSSCATYQYVVMDSTVPKDGDNQLVFENDTVKVHYVFDGVDCPASIRVFNKLTSPLYVDWQRSTFIVDQKAINQWEEKTAVDATATNLDVRWNKTTTTGITDIEGTLAKNSSQSFVPPGAYVQSPPTSLRSDFFSLPANTGEAGTHRTAHGNYRTRNRVYSRNNSPLVLRNYLTLSLDKDFKETFVLDNEFWVNIVIQSAATPGEVAKSDPGRTDQFYLVKRSGAGLVVGTMAVVGVYALAAAGTQTIE